MIEIGFHHCCPTNPVLQKRKTVFNEALQAMKHFPHMPKLNGASLLPPGEGQDEGIHAIGSLGHLIPSPQPSPGGRGSLWGGSGFQHEFRFVGFVDFVANSLNAGNAACP
jgi:hypothetical protein